MEVLAFSEFDYLHFEIKKYLNKYISSVILILIIVSVIKFGMFKKDKFKVTRLR